MKVLLVEDDRMIGASLMRGLQDQGYVVDWVFDGESASTALSTRDEAFSLVLLDWGLPKRDGLSVLRQLREHGTDIPVLMLTARDALDDRVMGLDSGADDYLVKPFALAELNARIRSLMRRRGGRTRNEIVHGELRVDLEACKVSLNQQPLELSAREFALLCALLERPGTVLSRRQLEAQLYGWVDAVESNVVEVVIHRLRKKLGANVIENVRGLGWRAGDAAP
jgi:two-component system response regulator QseB